jgi:hypothetical protein
MMIAAVAVVIAASGLAVFQYDTHSVPKSSAAQLQFCSQSGSGYCLNDWNGGGLGNQVKMYKGNVSHESFTLINANECTSNSTVTSTCPFTHHDLDSEYLNHKIVEVYYTPNGLCVGSGTGSSGSLQYCSGANRGNGVVMIQSGGALINRYWSDLHDQPVIMCSSGYSGGPVYLNHILSGSGSCEWGS